MLESSGLLTIAFRRTHIKDATIKDGNIEEQIDIKNKWLTSPYCHIEPAMAFQIGLPILIFREKGVIEDGILEKGVIGIYMPEFNLEDSNLENYFKNKEWTELVARWENSVRTCYNNMKIPPKLY